MLVVGLLWVEIRLRWVVARVGSLVYRRGGGLNST